MLFKAKKRGVCIYLFILLSFNIYAQNQKNNLFYDPDAGFSGNVAVVSNYIFRGESLSEDRPALQGGIDYLHHTSFFVGNWSSVTYADTPVEIDLYAGYQFTSDNNVKIIPKITGFIYPANWKDNSLEGTIEIDYGFAGIQYNYDFVQEQHYLTGGINIDLSEKFLIAGHIGMLTKVDKTRKYIYDYELLVEYTLHENWILSGMSVYHTEKGYNLTIGARFEF